MRKAIEGLGDATGETGWRKTYARKWTPPAQVCGAWRRKVEQTPEQVMRSALDAFGTARQVDKCLEELGELAAALIQYRQGRIGLDTLRGEIADVLVTAGTLRLLYGAAEVDAIAAVKLRRLVRLVADQVAANAEKPKPVKPVLRWEDEGNAMALHLGYQQIGIAELHKSGRWIADPFGKVAATSDTKEGAMRHVERMLRLPEIDLWTPTLPT